jgi:hypothetical protein
VKRLAALGGLVAVGAGLGTYFALQGTSYLRVAKAQQNPILEEALRREIIRGYRAVPGPFGVLNYRVSAADIRIEFPGACGDRAGPCMGVPILWLEYGERSRSQAQQLLKLARARWRGKVESFEITTLGG